MVQKDCDSSEASSQSLGFGDGFQGPESSWGLISRRKSLVLSVEGIPEQYLSLGMFQL